MKKQYIAIDQYGQTWKNLEHPRKDLMKKIGCSHAEKMYVDGEDGKAYHIGYVIGGLWLNVYEITPMMKEA